MSGAQQRIREQVRQANFSTQGGVNGSTVTPEERVAMQHAAAKRVRDRQRGS